MKVLKKIWGTIKKRKKTAIAVAIILILVINGIISGSKGAAANYKEDTVTKRNLATYHTFTGNITPVEDRGVLTTTSAKVDKILVSEGAEVTEGTPLIILDSTNLSQSIAELEATVKNNKTSSDYNLKDAQKAYDDYKYSIESGLNAQVISANAALSNAQSALESAQKIYNNAQSDFNAGYSSQVSSAKQAVESALLVFNNAKKAYDENEGDIRGADKGVDSSESAYDNNESAISELEAQIAAETDSTRKSQLQSQLTTLIANRTKLATGVTTSEATVESLKKARSTTEKTLESATQSYDNAVQNYLLAYKNAGLTVDTYYDNVLSAQTAYNNAVLSYNATMLSVEQTLPTYKQALDKVKAIDSNAVYNIQLKNLYKQLDDCTIKAPLTGTVTSIDVKEGEMTVAGKQIAMVTAFDTMKVEIKINEYDILGAEEGKEVAVYVDALEKTYNGKIVRIDKVATVEKGVSYFGAEVDFTADYVVRSGMSVEVKLKNKSADNVLTILSEAVKYEDDNTAYVMVKNAKGKMEKKTLSVGITNGTYIEITDGLSENDKVYVEATRYISDAEIRMN